MSHRVELEKPAAWTGLRKSAWRGLGKPAMERRLGKPVIADNLGKPGEDARPGILVKVKPGKLAKQRAAVVSGDTPSPEDEPGPPAVDLTVPLRRVGEEPSTGRKVGILALGAQMEILGGEPGAGGGGNPPVPTVPTESPGGKVGKEQDPPARTGLTRRVGEWPEIKRGENRTRTCRTTRALTL